MFECIRAISPKSPTIISTETFTDMCQFVTSNLFYWPIKYSSKWFFWHKKIEKSKCRNTNHLLIRIISIPLYHFSGSGGGIRSQPELALSFLGLILATFALSYIGRCRFILFLQYYLRLLKHTCGPMFCIIASTLPTVKSLIHDAPNPKT